MEVDLVLVLKTLLSFFNGRELHKSLGFRYQQEYFLDFPIAWEDPNDIILAGI